MRISFRGYLFLSIIAVPACSQQIWDIVRLSYFLSLAWNAGTDANISSSGKRHGIDQSSSLRSPLPHPSTSWPLVPLEVQISLSMTGRHSNQSQDSELPWVYLDLDRLRLPSNPFSSVQLADTSALTLNNLKVGAIYLHCYQCSWRVTKARNSGNYQNLLNYMFSPTDGANAAGLNYIRVPIGASDFSTNRMSFLRLPWFGTWCYLVYSLDDISGDTSFSNFDINKIPSYVFSVLRDIQSKNSHLKIHLLPWSPVSGILRISVVVSSPTMICI